MLEKCGYKEYAESAEYIKRLIGSTPDIAIILGSGLDRIVRKMTEKVVIPYRDIPNFPVSTVSYQKGELVFGMLAGVPTFAVIYKMFKKSIHYRLEKKGLEHSESKDE